MQHERVNVRSKLSDKEGHLVSHEPGDEVNVAAQTIQLGNRHVAPEFPCGGESCLELRSSVQGVRPLAGLHLNELACDRKPFDLSEVRECLPLGLYAQARAGSRGPPRSLRSRAACVRAPAMSARLRTSEAAVRTSEPSTVAFLAPCQPLP